MMWKLNRIAKRHLSVGRWQTRTAVGSRQAFGFRQSATQSLSSFVSKRE
ncbi:hypothetical protein MLGJGCBP_00893 [Rhodococcus sp. T7]|nr:hypothetical protein MLGJGCBP_09295 [Rhodococcus sp. T7]KAF0965950.1 hypothetical protein MLGJGCBP_00893 [Rhodococcus sp. T7]